MALCLANCENTIYLQEKEKKTNDWLMILNDLKSENFFLIASFNLLESEKNILDIARKIAKITTELHVPFVFNGSSSQANYSSEIGIESSLNILRNVRELVRIPVAIDIYKADEAAMAAEYVDILQIPAFLCRQTELLVAAANTGKIVNIKKGQFLSPQAIRFATQKVLDAGNTNVMLTERGVSFGYSDLTVDFRAIQQMQSFGFPVILDVTQCAHVPNLLETVCKAGIAADVDGLFLETHPTKDANMFQLHQLEKLLQKLIRIKQALW